MAQDLIFYETNADNVNLLIFLKNVCSMQNVFHNAANHIINNTQMAYWKPNRMQSTALSKARKAHSMQKRLH